MSDALDDRPTVGADTSKKAPTAASGLAPPATPKKVETYGPEYGKWLKSTHRDTPIEADEADTLRAELEAMRAERDAYRERAELLAANLADLRLALDAVTWAIAPSP